MSEAIERRTPDRPPENPQPLPIDVVPFAPGQLMMTVPMAMVLSADQAGQLVVRLHGAIDRLRKLDAGRQAKLAAAQKNGKAGRKGIARKKSSG